MAKFDLSDNNIKKNSEKKTKIWGITLIFLCTFFLLVLLTNFMPDIRSFMFGIFGLSIYPLTIITLCIGIALINNKKYVMPKKYIVYLSVTTYVFLSLIDIIILGNPNVGVFEQIANSFNFKYTAGGVLTSILLSPFLKTIGISGTVIIYCVVLVVFIALIADFLNSVKVYGYKKLIENNKGKKITKIEKVEKNNKVISQQFQTELPKTEIQQEKKEDFNVFVDDKFKEQENNIALIKLGLIEGNIESAKKEEEKPFSIREHLLTPPKIDLSIYKNQNIPKKEEISSNFNDIKRIDPNTNYTERQSIENKNQEFSNFFGKQSINNNAMNQTFFYEDYKKSEERPKKFIDLSSEEYKQRTNIEENIVHYGSNYKKPPLNLLKASEINLISLNEDIVGKRVQLENALKTFGINAKVIGVVVGPSVTRYELEMPHGVSVKRLFSLEDDISLAMASKAGIRIEAPIPGKSAVGIEVPNDNIATVTLREVLESETYQKIISPLTFALGKDISGNVQMCNLTKMPHLLIAGATNSGKSICLNTIILSMIFKASPEDVRIILIDPKRVEFSLYNGLPHLLIPDVITDVNKANNALAWCVREMEKRYEYLQQTRSRSLEEYLKTNEVLSGELPKFPYIVVVVDELADLMMYGKKDIEDKIRLLTQKSRASGIHLVLATQRPSVDVITGVIKSNCPSRISFALTSGIDSRTILDTTGAENLLGRGDMLFKTTESSDLKRIQGCFVSTSEIEAVLDYIKENNVYTYDKDTQEEIEKEQVESNVSQIDSNVGDSNFDPLLPQALKMFIENGQASTSAISRRFLTGYPRAARILDQIESLGYVSPPDGTKPRNVLITMEEFIEKYGKDIE